MEMVDFLNPEKSILLGGELQKVPKVQVWENIVIPESRWFNIDEKVAYQALSYVFENPYEIKSKGKSLMRENRDKFTLNKMAEKLNEIMQKHTKDLPSQVQLKLPKLKKVDKKEPPKIKLPKLKKMTEEIT